MNKKEGIILAAPINFGFGNTIKNELAHQGFQVIDLSRILETPFKYKSIFQRSHNFLRKVFLNDRLFKTKLRRIFYLKNLEDELDKIHHVKYALFIRPDMYPLEIISKVKERVDKLIAYQWDGINRFPEVVNYIPLFDSFYVFDPKDINVFPSTIPCTNFYFPRLPSPKNNSQLTYYIGGFFQERLDLLSSIKNILDKLEISNKIIFSTDSQRAMKSILEKGLHFINKDTTYEENLSNVMEATVLIDIQNTIHDGLSFRVFESIGYDKKLITTNPSIMKYDFYNPSNILIWNNQSEKEIQEFYNKPYEPLPPVVKQKYSFENWIKFILKIEGHIPLEIPL